MVTFHQNIETDEFFFSTDHCQELSSKYNNFVPCSIFNTTIQRQREVLIRNGGKEIPNPNKRFQPKEIGE